MLVLVLCGINIVIALPPVIAAPPTIKPPIVQPINTSLCDLPVTSELPPPGLVFPPTARYVSPTIDGQVSAARRLYQRSFDAVGKVEQIEALDRTIAFAPNHMNAYFQRANAHKTQKNWIQALADFDRSYQLSPQEHDRLGEQGLIYGELQDWKKLIGVYQQLIVLDPPNALHYHTIVARGYGELQQWPQVVEAYTTAIRLTAPEGLRLIVPSTDATPAFMTQSPGSLLYHPLPATLYLYRSDAYARQNQTQLAQADNDRAFRLVQKQSPWAIVNLYRERCRLKVRSGDRPGAIADARIAKQQAQALWRNLPSIPGLAMPTIVSSPSTGTKHPRPFATIAPKRLLPEVSPSQLAPPLANDRTRPPIVSQPLAPIPVEPTETAQQSINRALDLWVGDRYIDGRSLIDDEVPPLALGYLDQAIQMQPNLAPAHYHRGIVRSQLQKYDAAIVDFDRAIALNPQFSLAHAARGEALRQIKRSDEAMTALDNALKLDPTLAAARLSQGLIWLERSDAKQAESAFNDVLIIDPESIEALTERSKIRRSRQDIVGSKADDRRVKQVRDRWNLPL
jgi:tetratricopeptide (TPR) repeat protein